MSGAGRPCGGGRSQPLKVVAGTGSPPRHPTVPMAPTLPLALLLALLAPGLGVAVPGCDYPAHLWCSSWEIAVACQVRAAGARAAPAAHPRWQPTPGTATRHAGTRPADRAGAGLGACPASGAWGVRGWRWGIAQPRSPVPVLALSIPVAQAGTPQGCSEPLCRAGTVALPSIPGKMPGYSRTPTPLLPRALLELLLFQHKTAFLLMPP